MPQGNKTYYTDTSEGLRPMNGMSETHPKTTEKYKPVQAEPQKDTAPGTMKDSHAMGGAKVVDVYPGTEFR